MEQKTLTTQELLAIAVDALEDVKAKDIQVIETSSSTALFDAIVVATGDSNRQTRALARSVHDKVKESGGDVLSIEGEETGEWLLVDLDDVVVHIMLPTVRAYYNLEDLWSVRPA